MVLVVRFCKLFIRIRRKRNKIVENFMFFIYVIIINVKDLGSYRLLLEKFNYLEVKVMFLKYGR